MIYNKTTALLLLYSWDFSFKMLLLGDSNSGKTALMIRFIQGIFFPVFMVTVGISFVSHLFSSFKIRNIKLLR